MQHKNDWFCKNYAKLYNEPEGCNNFIRSFCLFIVWNNARTPDTYTIYMTLDINTMFITKLYVSGHTCTCI